MTINIGVEYGVIYTLTGPDGTVAVFNDSTSPNYVGILSPESSGLDSAEVREDAQDTTEGDGGIHGDFYYGRRPVILQGTVIASGRTDRAQKIDKIRRASNAMRGDAILSWTPSAGSMPVRLKLRRQQPLRFTKGWVKDFMIPMVSAKAFIESASEEAIGGTTNGAVETIPATVENKAGAFAEPWATLNPVNIQFVSDGLVISNPVAAEHETDALKANTPFSGLGLASWIIPRGIEMKLRRKGWKAATFDPGDADIRLEKAGVAGGTQKANFSTKWPSAMAELAYGGPTDLWGQTWTKADLENSKFGPRIAGSAGSESGTLEIDRVLMKLYYDAPPVNAANSGDAPAYPKFKIERLGGTLLNPEIKNVTTGKTLKLNISYSGAYIIVDFENKTVVDDTGANHYDAVDFVNSTWWALEPLNEPQYVNVYVGGNTSQLYTVYYRHAWV